MWIKKEPKERCTTDTFSSPKRVSHNYYEIASTNRAEATLHERQLVRAPLIGSGAGLIAVVSLVNSDLDNTALEAYLLFSAFFFMVSVAATFSAGWAYWFALEHRSIEFTELGNAQNIELDVFDKLKAEQDEMAASAWSEHRSKRITEVLDDINVWIDQANVSDSKAVKCINVSRFLYIAAILSFMIGITLSLLGFVFT